MQTRIPAADRATFPDLQRAGRKALDAGLLLLEAEPLEDISHTTRISGVMLAGRWLTTGTPDARVKR